MIISLIEILRIAIMTLAIGYILSPIISTPSDPLLDYRKKKYFNWESIKLGVFAAAPGIVLHEMAHKFVALAYGLQAEFFASYIGLGVGVILKLVGSPFLLFVPGYVQILGATPLQSAITAFAGPAMNGFLWLISWYILSTKPNLSHRNANILFLTKRINGVLFLFNLIPFPPFDGGHVFEGLMQTYFV